MTAPFAHARGVIRDAVAARACPAAVVEVGRSTGVLWRGAFGQLTYEADAAPVRDDTVFDLASLTKVIATASLAMRLIDRGRLRLDDPVSRWLPAWRGSDREAVTVRDLLAHASGLTAWLPFYRDYTGRAEFERAICTMPLEYPPRSKSIYSDLGFILLGFIIEDAAGISLARQVTEVSAELGIGASELAFCPGPLVRARAAPTEVDSWRGRLLVGEVHDENAWALGGTAGHSGLFGTAEAVGCFARAVLASRLGRSPEQGGLAAPGTVRTFTVSADVPESSRALGWDAMRPTSSCGTRMSRDAFGHTGFTGTSLWIDPQADAYVALLTNRVHPTRTNEAIQKVRPAFHDAVMEELAGGPGGPGGE